MTVLNWKVESLLVSRTLRVKIGSHLSPRLSVKAGVTQGSVLYADIFVICINNLLEQYIFPGPVSAFAIDIALFFSEKGVKFKQTSI